MRASGGGPLLRWSSLARLMVVFGGILVLLIGIGIGVNKGVPINNGGTINKAGNEALMEGTFYAPGASRA
eukprot:14395518-Alexandrium_andersonii.AAC.1